MAASTVCAIAAPLKLPQHGCRTWPAYSDPDAAGLAAAYAYGLLHNHGFADGNKRTAWVIARLFLGDNGYLLRFDPVEAVRMVEAVAAGTVEEDQLAEWFRRRIMEHRS
jgi:death-on-curing protein